MCRPLWLSSIHAHSNAPLRKKFAKRRCKVLFRRCYKPPHPPPRRLSRSTTWFVQDASHMPNHCGDTTVIQYVSEAQPVAFKPCRVRRSRYGRCGGHQQHFVVPAGIAAAYMKPFGNPNRFLPQRWGRRTARRQPLFQSSGGASFRRTSAGESAVKPGWRSPATSFVGLRSRCASLASARQFASSALAKSAARQL